MPRDVRLVIPLLVALVLGMGCRGHVTLVAHPVGAYVTAGKTRVGVAPVDLPVPLIGGRRATVERTGYRTVNLRLTMVPPRKIEVRLVPEHGGAGTWDPDDIK